LTDPQQIARSPCLALAAVAGDNADELAVWKAGPP
jgi:hypothetical protein